MEDIKFEPKDWYGQMAVKFIETDPQISHAFHDEEPKWLDDAELKLDIAAIYEFAWLRDFNNYMSHIKTQAEADFHNTFDHLGE